MTIPKKVPEDKVAVTFTRPHEIGGKTYKTDEDAVLDPGDADPVLRLGIARPHDAGWALRYGFPLPEAQAAPTIPGNEG